MSKKPHAAQEPAPETPKPEAQPAQPAERIELFRLDPNVGMLIVHPLVVDTLRSRMGHIEIESKVRNLEAALQIANNYINALLGRITALEQAGAPKA